MIRQPELNITVRYIKDLYECGLFEVDGVQFIKGEMNNEYSDIPNYDVIIASDTFATMSVALGVPLLMMNSEADRLRRNERDRFRAYKARERYRRLTAYPFNIEEVISSDFRFMHMLHRAMKCPVSGWKRAFVGHSFDAGKFVGLLENYYREKKSCRAFERGLDRGTVGERIYVEPGQS